MTLNAMSKNLVTIQDLSAEDVDYIFSIASQVKSHPDKYETALQGNKYGLLFEKPSTRTLISFDVGIYSLGAGSIYIDRKLGQREEIRDVARTLDRYLDGLILRTFSHETILEFQRYFTGLLINGLSDYEHPCQALADLFTVKEREDDLRKVTIAYVGDGNNVLNSLLLLSAKVGLTLNIACPKKYEVNSKVLEEAKVLAAATGAKLNATNDPKEAVRGADFIYTDVWVSMGEENSRDEKLKAFAGMQVNSDLLKLANPDARVMHCLPAHRGEEITDEVMEGPQSIVFDQAENRLHVQKAILLHLSKEST